MNAVLLATRGQGTVHRIRAAVTEEGHVGGTDPVEESRPEDEPDNHLYRPGRGGRPSRRGSLPVSAARMVSLGRSSERSRSASACRDRLHSATTVTVRVTDAELRPVSAIGEPLAPLVGDLAGSIRDDDLVQALEEALAGSEVTYTCWHRGRAHEVRVGPLRDSRHDVVGTVTVVIDVGVGRVRSGIDGEADERLRKLIDFSPAFVGLRDSAGRLLHANPAFRHTFYVADPHATPESGGAFDRAVPVEPNGPETDDALRGESLRTVRLTGRPRVWEGMVVQPDGHRVHLLGHLFPLPMPDGSTGTGEVYLDLTPQDAAHAERSATEQRYRALFESVGVGVLLLDVDGRIVDANPATSKLVGRSRSELRGRFLGLITSRAEIESHREVWEGLMAGGRSRFDWPTTIRHSDGRLHHATAVMMPLREGARRPVGAMVVVTPHDHEWVRTDDGHRRVEVTPQQAVVLERLAAGAGLSRIADELDLSRRGIDYRVSQLRQRLRMPEDGVGRPTTASLVARAYAVGLMHPTRWPPKVIGVAHD